MTTQFKTKLTKKWAESHQFYFFFKKHSRFIISFGKKIKKWSDSDQLLFFFDTLLNCYIWYFLWNCVVILEYIWHWMSRFQKPKYTPCGHPITYWEALWSGKVYSIKKTLLLFKHLVCQWSYVSQNSSFKSVSGRKWSWF
jgi:hypothetical protein